MMRDGAGLTARGAGRAETAWMPASLEGRAFYRLGVGSLVTMLVLVALAFTCFAFWLLRAQRESDLQLQVQLAATLDPARALPASGQGLYVWRVGADGRVTSSTLPDTVGKTGDEAVAVVEKLCPHPMMARAVRGDETIVAAAPGFGLSDALFMLAVATATSLLLGTVMVTFFRRLGATWVVPLERVVDADRASRDERTGQTLEPTDFPGGLLRELVVRRNQRLDALRAKDDALSRRGGEMEMLYELSRQMGLSREAPDVSNLALSFLSRVVDYDAGAMLIYTDDQRTLTLRARAPLHERVKAEIEVAAVNAFFERTGILLESDVLELREHVGDTRAPRLEGKVRAAQQWMPLSVNDRVVGVMGLLMLFEKQTAAAESARMVKLVAQNASLALEKFQLQRLEETQRFRNVLENLIEGVVLVRQTGEWALATGTARAFHQVICQTPGQPSADHVQRCPISILGLDVFHSGATQTSELSRDERTFILVGTFVRSAAAGERGAVISIRDVTEERATQQKLLQASKLASLGELAAGVAHEVNNPLTGILGFTELTLARKDLSAPVAESLQEIHALARRTSQITSDLLLFARGQRDGGFRAVSMRSVVRDTLKLLGTSYRNLPVELVADLRPEDDRLLALGDQGKILQIITNLAQNAKDAITMANKGRVIRFRGYRSEGQIVLEVADDGPGIPDRIRAKILEPFFTTKPIGKGTGLGLAIVGRLVQEHGGTLEIESEEGQGTTFRIRLPQAPPGTAEAPAETIQVPSLEPAEPPPTPVVDVTSTPPAPAPPQGEPRGTLVVLDDEVTVLKFLTRSLESEGFEVLTTSQADEALAWIEQRTPDLVFCDFRMPDITGEEVYARLVDLDPKWAARIVFLSGDLSGDDIQGFLSSTGAPALRKPVGIRELRAYVEEKLASLRGVAG